MALTLTRLIHRLLGVRASAAGTTDGELLERFARQRDEAAFEALLWRHGPMVLATCRRVLADEQEAEDAFQATFLVLARKADTLGRRAALPGWLHRVAFRIALRAGRRRRLDPLPADPVSASACDADRREVGLVLEEEIQRLPEKYRVPFVLCYLQGQTNAQAALALACPAGTVATRLTWARERLQVRLTRRGITLALAAALALLAAEPVSAALVHATTRAALTFTGPVPLARLSPRVVSWSKGELRTMLWHKLTIAAVVTLGFGLALTAGGWLGRPVAAVQAYGPEEKALAHAPEDPKKPVEPVRADVKEEEARKQREEEAALRERELAKLEQEWKDALQEIAKKRVELRVAVSDLRDRIDSLEHELSVTAKSEANARAAADKAALSTDKKERDAAAAVLEQCRALTEKARKSLTDARRELLMHEENLALFDLEQEWQLSKIRRQRARLEGQPVAVEGTSNKELERKLDLLLKEVRELKKQK